MKDPAMRRGRVKTETTKEKKKKKREECFARNYKKLGDPTDRGKMVVGPWKAG